jgi:hypothetical protein
MRITLLGILTAAAFLTGACAAQRESTGRSLAFKGIELYSWRGGDGQWSYSLQPGTNRRKFKSEVQAAPLTLEQLEPEIGKLPEGESLLWGNVVSEDGTGKELTLEFPPKEKVERLRALAEKRGVHFWTALDPEQ